MEFKLAVIDWNTISAISTFIAVLIALFYQPFQNRRKVIISTSLTTDTKTNQHSIKLTVTNLSSKPVCLTTFGILYKKDGKTLFNLIGGQHSSRLLQPSEPISFPEEPISFLLESVENLYTKDSYGKFWYMTRKNKKQFELQREICLVNNEPKKSKTSFKLVERPSLKKKNNR